jgi:hypothetical protein
MENQGVSYLEGRQKKLKKPLKNKGGKPAFEGPKSYPDYKKESNAHHGVN